MDLWELFDFYWNKNYDPRVIDLPFIRSMYTVPVILFSYLYFVTKCGPNYMKNRKPYELKTFIKYYNIFQILGNGLMVQQLISAGWFSRYSVYCEMPDFSYSPNAMKITRLMWCLLIIKLIDLVETIVFALRKKNNQISFLHLYHHVSMVLIQWLITRYVPVAGATFPLLVNSSVHVIMYTYYLLSSYEGKIRKAITPYKPIITIVQMLQFIILIFYCIQPFVISCDVPKLPSIVTTVNLLINFVLFYNFYRQSYLKPAHKTS